LYVWSLGLNDEIAGVIQVMIRRDSYQDWKDSITERRKWERYTPTKGTMAWLDGKSYRMMDISLGGLSIYEYGEDAVPEETIIGLHCFEEGFFLDAIRCRKVSDQRVVSQSQHGEVVLNRVGLEILENDPELEQKLAPFISDH
jgi:hypothetical protein